MNQLEQWLSKLPRISQVAPVQITINKVRYEGARYVQTGEYTAGMDAVTRGQRKAGETYEEERIYLLGNLPKVYQRSTRTCFRFAGDSRDWYIACYHGAPPEGQGPMFILSPWTLEQKIDHYDIMAGRKAYKRVGAFVAAA